MTAPPRVAGTVPREHSSTGACRLTVRVQPRATSNEVAGVVGDAIKIRLTAPPVDGAANAALIAFLADTLGLPRSAIHIVAGDHARTKVVAVRGLDLTAVRRRLIQER